MDLRAARSGSREPTSDGPVLLVPLLDDRPSRPRPKSISSYARRKETDRGSPVCRTGPAVSGGGLGHLACAVVFASARCAIGRGRPAQQSRCALPMVVLGAPGVLKPLSDRFNPLRFERLAPTTQRSDARAGFPEGLWLTTSDCFGAFPDAAAARSMPMLNRNRITNSKQLPNVRDESDTEFRVFLHFPFLLIRICFELRISIFDFRSSPKGFDIRHSEFVINYMNLNEISGRVL